MYLINELFVSVRVPKFHKTCKVQPAYSEFPWLLACSTDSEDEEWNKQFHVKKCWKSKHLECWNYGENLECWKSNKNMRKSGLCMKFETLWSLVIWCNIPDKFEFLHFYICQNQLTLLFFLTAIFFTMFLPRVLKNLECWKRKNLECWKSEYYRALKRAKKDRCE